jgi:HB1/ASXL restriction endonuclease-like protein with HTH domain
MSAKNKGAKGAKTKQRAEKAKPATKLIPELAAMKFPAKMVAKLEALAEADQDTVLNYVNSGMKINDAYQRTIAGKPEHQQQPEPDAATPTGEAASTETATEGQAAAEATPEATPGAGTTPTAETAQAGEPATQPEAKKRGRAPKAKAETGPKKLSAIDAAAKVLAEAGEPMDCQTMIKTMAEKGYWTSPGGKTPAATLYSAILRELQTKGNDSRFKKTERGKFAIGGAS